MYKLFLLTFLCCLSQYHTARILAVFPTPSISHQVTFRPVIQELVKRGHEVVVITTDPAFQKGEKPDNLTEIDVHDVSYKIWNDKLTNDAASFGAKDVMNNQIILILHTIIEVFETQMKVEEVQNLIKNERKSFDLIIIEAYVQPTLALSHIFKVPVIQMSSFLPIYIDLKNVGAPDHPILYPTFRSQKLDDLSVLDKLTTFLRYYFVNMESYEAIVDDLNKRIFGSDIPSITELYKNIDMLFLNTFPIWDSNRPMPPSVQYIGGIHITASKELPQDLESFLNSSEHGVIYLSFGTNVNPSTLPSEKIQIFVNVLSSLPYDVIWKWDKDELPGRSKNIKISKWLPQADLLRHSKIKLFITQGGLQSSDEAIAAGVPLLGIPLLADQWYNVAMYLRHNIGIKLNIDDISEKSLKAAIETLTKDDTYRQNVIKLRSILYDQPQTPLERAVWWTEYVLRHGGARHLRSPAAFLPWTTYYQTDLMFYLLLAALPVLYLLVTVVLATRNLYYAVKAMLN